MYETQSKSQHGALFGFSGDVNTRFLCRIPACRHRATGEPRHLTLFSARSISNSHSRNSIFKVCKLNDALHDKTFPILITSTFWRKVLEKLVPLKVILLQKKSVCLVCLRIGLLLENSNKNQFHLISFCN